MNYKKTYGNKLTKTMSHQYHICKDKKEKIVGDLPILYCGHRPRQKSLPRLYKLHYKRMQDNIKRSHMVH
jgi:hypothetical protein